MFAATDTSGVLHDSAERAIGRQDLGAVKRILKRCVQLDRTDARAWELYGHVHYDGGNFPLAVAAFERAAQFTPLGSSARIALALSRARLGQINEAECLLTDLLHEDELTSEQLLRVAMGLNAVEQVSPAIDACRKALRQDADCAQAYFDLGYYSDRAGFPLATVERLTRRALKVNPGNPRYRIGLACLLVRNEELDEAWRVIRDLGLTDISAVSCACCLEKLLALYRRADDQRRLIVCHQRLVELRLRGCGFAC